MVAADSAPACRVERGWRSSQRLGGSENSANTCLKEGQEAMQQLLLPLWAVSGRDRGGGALSLLFPPSARLALALLRQLPGLHATSLPTAQGLCSAACPSRTTPHLEQLLLLPNSAGTSGLMCPLYPRAGDTGFP